MSLEVVAIGRINIDIVMQVEKLPVSSDHVISKGSHLAYGGSAANFATQSARLGVKTGLISCVGDDPYGQMALKNLSKIGIETKGILVLENQPTGIFFIARDPQNNTAVFTEQGANRFLEKHVLDESYLSRTRTLHIAGGFPMMTRRAIEFATQNGMILSFDPGRAADTVDFSKILRSVDLLFLNEFELREYLGINAVEEELRAFAKSFPGILVVKMGDKGAIATDGFEYCTSQKFEVSVMDTLGAGDSFAAAFVVAWTRVENIEQALTFANATAALTITKKGAQKGQPTLDDVSKLLREHDISMAQLQSTFAKRRRRR